MPTLKPPKSPLKSSAGKETKPSFSRTQPQPLNQEEALEANEAQFWKEVAEKSESLIANLIESILPISATPSVFNLAKDKDYLGLLKYDLPETYQDNEEYLAKLEIGSWTAEDVEFVAEDLTCHYFEIVVKSLADWLSSYPNFENSSLSQLKE